MARQPACTRQGAQRQAGTGRLAGGEPVRSDSALQGAIPAQCSDSGQGTTRCCDRACTPHGPLTWCRSESGKDFGGGGGVCGGGGAGGGHVRQHLRFKPPALTQRQLVNVPHTLATLALEPPQCTCGFVPVCRMNSPMNSSLYPNLQREGGGGDHRTTTARGARRCAAAHPPLRGTPAGPEAPGMPMPTRRPPLCPESRCRSRSLPGRPAGGGRLQRGGAQLDAHGPRVHETLLCAAHNPSCAAPNSE